MSILRSVLFNVLTFSLTGILLFAYAPALLFPPPATLACIRFWIGSIFFLQRTVLRLDFEFRGTENLPDGPFIVASAHQSAWETVGFYAIFRSPAYVLKSELYRIPMFAPYARKLGMISIDRSGNTASARRMLQDTSTALAEDRPVIIFPGGTRSPPGEAFDIRPGVGALYRHCNVPVVPASLNSGLYWGRRSFVKKPGTIIVEFGEPLPPGLERDRFTETLARRLIDGNGRLLTAGD